MSAQLQEEFPTVDVTVGQSEEDHMSLELADKIETGLINALESLEDIKDFTDAVEEAAEVGDKLQEIKATAAGILEEDSVTPAKAKLIQTAIDALAEDVGFDISHTTVSLESMVDGKSAATALRLSLEALEETNKSIFSKINDSVQALGVKSQKFFVQMAETVSNTKKRLERAQSNFNKNGTKEITIVNNKFLASHLNIDGRSTNQLGKELTHLASALRSALAFSTDLFSDKGFLKYRKDIGEVFLGKDLHPEMRLPNIPADFKAASDAEIRKTGWFERFVSSTSKELNQFATAGSLLGNSTLLLTRPKPNLNIADEIKALTYTKNIGVRFFKGKVVMSDIKTLNENEVNQALAALKVLLDELSKVKGLDRTFAVLKAADMNSASNNIGSKVVTALNFKNKESIRLYRFTVASLLSSTQHLFQFQNEVLTVANAAIRLIELSTKKS